MNFKRLLAMILCVVLCCFMLCSCNNTKSKKDTLVVGVDTFSGKFSPFFAETTCDQTITDMTMIKLLTQSRSGSIVREGIEGETIAYNGTEYTYYGPTNLTVTENKDGSVDYDFTLRDKVKFSDGSKMTIDDVLFTMYVLCDPAYDGPSAFSLLPIEGLQEYCANMKVLAELLLEAGRDNKDFSKWTEKQQADFWTDLDQAGDKFCQEIIEYCVSRELNKETDSVAACASNWGYKLGDKATTHDFFMAMCEKYEWDLAALSQSESAGSSLFALMEHYDDFTNAISVGDSKNTISGIQKTGENSLRIHMTKSDATAIYELAIPIAPLAYYGDKENYNFDQGKFGFPKGDLSGIREKNGKPIGAGPYVFASCENGTATFDANNSYYLGSPKTKHVQFVEVQDADRIHALESGTIDLTEPGFSTQKMEEIISINVGSLSGAKITTKTFDTPGHGYMGINAKRVNVGNQPGSVSSMDLRKAIATVVAVYREQSVSDYYGDRAAIIDYPISSTSWASPQKADEGYQVAYSLDINKKPIYTASMKQEEKEKAALKACLGFLESAGYTIEKGKVTKAPVQSRTSFDVWIPAGGTGDHVCYQMLVKASKALESIGITLKIQDLTNAADLWSGLENGMIDMWCSAWGSGVDPDMYQLFYSDVDNEGRNAGRSNYMYAISDSKLDSLIVEARSSLDQNFRKEKYKECLNIVLDWGVELPIYQRQDAVIFSTEHIQTGTFTPDIGPFYSWMNEIQNIAVQ